METIIVNNGAQNPVFPAIIANAEPVYEAQFEPQLTTPKPFIEANTKPVEMKHLQDDCIIPVFSKDNEVTISHQSFIEAVMEAAKTAFPYERITDPEVRVSHVVKGRIPEAIHKPVSLLLESDKTIYYERMMFCVEIPTIHQDIEGCRLNLTVGGVRAYNEQNLYAKKSPEKFKIFIGFKNLVCCNLCVSTDGFKASLRVMDIAALLEQAIELFRLYNAERHLALMTAFRQYSLSETQFAQFLGKSRLYQYLPVADRKLLPPLQMTDTQINLVAKAYYDDSNFGRNTGSGDISLWNMYNLFTGSNKSSYIDNFLDRASNATDVSAGICRALLGEPEYSWFIK